MPQEGGPNNPVILDPWQSIIAVNFPGGKGTITWGLGNIIDPGEVGNSGYGARFGGFAVAGLSDNTGGFTEILNATTLEPSGYTTNDGWILFLSSAGSLTSADLSFDWCLEGTDNTNTYSATLKIAFFLWDPVPEDGDTPLVLTSATGSLSGSGTMSGLISSSTLTFSFSGPLAPQNPPYNNRLVWVGYTLSLSGPADGHALTGLTLAGSGSCTLKVKI
jgi:hypothetical protein